jgi:tol-pal system protein YbgF
MLAGSTPLGAANKEHQQMLADIRMLQEQSLQLQQTLGTLIDALQVVTSKIDEQAGASRKAAADQKLLIDGLAGELRIVREKLDDTNVRLGTISQEVDALRNSIPQMPVGVPATVDPNAPPAPTDPAAPGVPGVTPPAATGAAPPPTAPAPSATGMSPSRLWDMAYSDYAAGQWALAIQGFETYLRTFPRTQQSDDAQFYIGEAYQLDGKYKEAVGAYERVINDFPAGDRTPDAYYKRGVAYSAMNQPDRARESWEIAIKQFPNTEAANLSRPLLARQGRR